MFRRRFQCCLAAASFVLAAVLYAQQPGPTDLDAYVARVLTTFDVPGISVAVVKDGKVVLAKGYGVRKLGRPDTVRHRVEHESHDGNRTRPARRRR